MALAITPRFTATTRLVYEPRLLNVGAPQVMAEANADSMAIDTQLEVVRSRTTIDRVVQQLNLIDDPEFNRARRPGLLACLYNAGCEPDTGTKTMTEIVSENVAARLAVRNLGLSSAINISFESISPSKAARVANSFADAYISNQLGLKEQATQRVTDWLQSKLDQLRLNAAQSDSALKQYQVSAGLVGIQGTAGTTTAQQDIQLLTTQISAARTQQAEAAARLKIAERVGDAADDFTDALNSPVIQALKRQRNEASATLAQLDSQFGTNYPPTVAANRKIADINRQLRAEVDRVRRAVAADYRAAKSNADNAQTRLEAATEALKATRIASVEEGELRNRAEADHAVYQSFLDRVKQTSAQGGVERADARVISVATMPTQPNPPGRRLIVLIGFLLGCAAGGGAAVRMESVRGGLYGPQQVARHLDQVCLGSIPNIGRSRDGCPIIDLPIMEGSSTFSEMLRGVVASEFFAMKAKRHMTVFLATSDVNEGKSTAAVALARTLALQGARTLLVDCDLARPTVTGMLGGCRYGIVELINGQATFEDVVQVDASSGLHWIGVGSEGKALGSLAKSNLPEIFAELGKHFDVTLLDGPPTLANSDASRLAMAADRVLLLVGWRHTPRTHVELTLKRLADLGIRPAGVILTRVNLRKQARMGDAGADYQRYQAYRRLSKA